MKNTIVMMILVAGFQIAFANTEDSVPNLHQPRYMVFTSGQPSAFGWREVAELGVKTVINVLPERECIPGEASLVDANQMEYIALPFDPEKLTTATIVEFSNLLNGAERPLLIHCSTGNHVGGLWFAYRMLVENASLMEALREGRTIGMKPAMEHTVLEWIRDQRRASAQAH